MTVAEFIAKWQQVELKERSAAHEHFLDLCSVLGHPTPATADPKGSDYCFEKGATKPDGEDGWADVWKRGFFAWEYKGKHANLDKAYSQLLLYRESLDNPPVMVVCDMDRIVIRTNFTNTPTIKHDISLDELAEPERYNQLRWVFFEPDRLKPVKTIQAVTEDAAHRITEIAQELRRRGFAPQKVARFLDRLVFCMFAQDVALLPTGLFRQLVENSYQQPEVFTQRITELFRVMVVGGGYGPHTIKYFNGDLFADIEVLELNEAELMNLRWVTLMDWSGIDASVFGTLFERALDPGKREQLGAHYTSREDIETLVEPVVMAPLRREWDVARAEVQGLLKPQKNWKAANAKANKILLDFIHRIQHVQILDPACGSGNFLYVALQKLKNLEKEIILFAYENGFSIFLPHVGPWQLHAIEVNPYAHELAQMTVWIGFLQWVKSNGFGEPQEPILQKLGSFTCADAILTFDEGVAAEPAWPNVDFIIGNPPFLGGKKMRAALDDAYVDNLFEVWADRVPAEADLCCYWFEKARAQIVAGKCVRAGLLATQGIRGGRNRDVLDRIKQTGDIFFGVSDRDWILEGANVHVSMVGFDAGEEQTHLLDGQPVAAINADLTSGLDVTVAKTLASQPCEYFQGPVRIGDFDISHEEALAFLHAPNPHGKPNSDVVRPTLNGTDNLKKPRNRWTIDFGQMSASEAALYELPFAHVEKYVKPSRAKNNRPFRRLHWWMHGENGGAMKLAFKPLTRFLALTQTSKNIVFRWHDTVVYPEQTVIVFASGDDYVFGVLQSRAHEVWARAKGTQLREEESGFRYTPTTCFDTFPFPHPTAAQRAAIAAAARELNTLRNGWLFPSSLTKQEALTFPAGVDGPWARLVSKANAEGIGTATFTRTVPDGAMSESSLAKRTLSRLYTQRPTWLQNAHQALDATVLEAYGWDAASSDDEILAKILELNLASATPEAT